MAELLPASDHADTPAARPLQSLTVAIPGDCCSADPPRTARFGALISIDPWGGPRLDSAVGELMESPHPCVCLDYYPVVIIRFCSDIAAGDVRALTHALRKFASGLDEPVAILSDLSQVKASDPEARTIYVEFVKDMKRSRRQWVRAAAVVTSNAFQRTVMNLHTTLVGDTPYPVRAFASQDQALPWLQARLVHSNWTQSSAP